MGIVQPGIEVLLQRHLDLLRGRRVGLITNHTGVSSTLESTVDLLVAHPDVRVTALFAGEHGIYGDVPAGVPVTDGIDERTGIRIWSLYDETKRPAAHMLEDIDVLVIDMQDSGARFYTYTWTMTLCMQAAAEEGKTMVVLDRPNPITGSTREGGLLHPGFESFVGLYPVPTRHGLTLGEIALLCNRAHGIGCNLHVIPCAGWQRSMWWEETRLPFVAMSPNTNSVEMLVLYPGTCFFEGTNLSEGRGTTLPFQLFGAPWLDERAVIDELRRRELPGVILRPAYFVPWYSKHQGQLCRGVQLHITDRDAVRPVALGAHLLEVCRQLHPDHFAWLEPGGGRLPAIDRLTGSDLLRVTLDAGRPVAEVLAAWEREADAFAERAPDVLLYR